MLSVSKYVVPPVPPPEPETWQQNCAWLSVAVATPRKRLTRKCPILALKQLVAGVIVPALTVTELELHEALVVLTRALTVGAEKLLGVAPAVALVPVAR
jgi:hypothetical protein